MPHSAQYSSLPQEDKTLADSNGNGTDYLQRFVYWSIVVISVCSVVDVLALAYFATHTSFKSAVSLGEPPIRSSYIQLDDLYLKKHHKSTDIEPILNLPKVLQVIDSSQPTRVFPQWEETWMTPHGIVPVNNRRILVTDTASTVAQFRVMDFGMEHCVVALTIPPRNATQSMDEGSAFDVWRLNEDHRLDFEKLSWKNKPERGDLLGHFTAAYGTTQTLAGFPCVSGAYLTIEVACSNLGPTCVFESVATQKNALGVYVQQHQTV